jgi:DNA-directed RNA polymerase III subunit RPC1
MKYYRLRELQRALPEVVVKVGPLFYLDCSHSNVVLQGVPTIHRAIINKKIKDDKKGVKGDNELLVEGYGLQKVMTTDGC